MMKIGTQTVVNPSDEPRMSFGYVKIEQKKANMLMLVLADKTR